MTKIATKHLLSVLAFIIISFAVQGQNHFVLNTSHYESIEFARAEPVMALGFLTMIVQGLILTFAMTKISLSNGPLRDGFLVSLSYGLYIAVYIAVTEPAKYAAPSIPSWVITEGLASTIQFVVFGVALGFIHQKFAPARQ